MLCLSITVKYLCLAGVGVSAAGSSCAADCRPKRESTRSNKVDEVWRDENDQSSRAGITTATPGRWDSFTLGVPSLVRGDLCPADPATLHWYKSVSVDKNSSHPALAVMVWGSWAILSRLLCRSNQPVDLGRQRGSGFK